MSARLTGWWLRVRACLRPRRLDQDLDDELRFHLDMREREFRDGGLSPDDARRRAAAQFGRLSTIRESTRDVWVTRSLDGLAQDLRYAFRALGRSPGFTFAAVATLAVGIGATSSVFSLANAVLLKPLQAPHADRLVRFQTISSGRASAVTSAQQFDYWHSQLQMFEDVAAHRLEFANLTGGASPEHVPVGRVSAAFFRLFGLPLVAGRPFTLDEDSPGGRPVAVLSHALWTRRYGQSRAVLGQSIALGGVPHTIVGILAAGFDSEQFDVPPDVWVPLQYDLSRIDAGDLCIVTGRLKPGVTVDAANASLRAADHAFPEYRARLTAQSAAGEPPTSDVRPLFEVMVGDMRASLEVLGLAVALVLLIACANVATLLLARASRRSRELAIRTALGASRPRLVRQLLCEAVVLALLGATIGVLLGTTTMRAVLALFPAGNPMLLGANATNIPRIGSTAAVSIDWRVLAFALVVSVAATLAFGLLPAFRGSRADLTLALKHTASTLVGGPRRWRTRSVLVGAELAIAVMLLIGAALLIRTFRAYLDVDTGFRPEHVITMRMAVGGTTFDTRDGIDALTRRGTSAIEALPGIVSASTACCMPLETVWQLPFVIQSRKDEGLTRSGDLAFHGFGGWTFVSPGYFETLGIPVVRGRSFTAADSAGSPGVVIINEALARRFWPDGDPLTDRLSIGRGMRPEYDADPVRQIVGIVRDVRTQGLARRPRPEMYVPVAQVPDGVTALNVRLLPIVWFARTAGEPYAASGAISHVLEDTSGLAVARVRSMSEVVSEATGRTRFDMGLMTLFGLSALLLAAVGVYGLTAYSVETRKHEIGIRLALGAAPSNVRNMLVGHMLVVAVTGIGTGAAGALGAKRLMEGLLFGVSPRDPFVFTAVPLVLAAVVLVAVWIPVRRATRVDPVATLRAE